MSISANTVEDSRALCEAGLNGYPATEQRLRDNVQIDEVDRSGYDRALRRACEDGHQELLQWLAANLAANLAQFDQPA